jgi:hypothetical protein
MGLRQPPRDALSPDLAEQTEIAADNQQITRVALVGERIEATNVRVTQAGDQLNPA